MFEPTEAVAFVIATPIESDTGRNSAPIRERKALVFSPCVDTLIVYVFLGGSVVFFTFCPCPLGQTFRISSGAEHFLPKRTKALPADGGFRRLS